MTRMSHVKQFEENKRLNNYPDRKWWCHEDTEQHVYGPGSISVYGKRITI
jgi:hypothetical protein